MTHFMRDGNRYAVAPAGALDISDHLPVGTYKVGYTEITDTFWLEKVDPFTAGGKIYGQTLTQRDRILHTFWDRAASTGVLLTGEKGSGKTLLAKLLSLRALEQDVPTLIINMPWCGDTFNAFMQTINQPVVVVFDEFEKVYDNAAQQKLLTLLDGTYSSKKLFILTANDMFKVDTHMTNRPGRIFYRIDYIGLDVQFVREYCQDNLLATDRVEDVIKTSRLFRRFNFDLLKALVEEMNRFDEPVEEALKMLNAVPESDEDRVYEMSVAHKGVPVPRDKLHSQTWRGNPLKDSFHCYFEGVPTPAQAAADGFTMDELIVGDGDGTMSIGFNFDAADLTRVNIESGAYVFEKDDVQVTLLERLTGGHLKTSMVY